MKSLLIISSFLIISFSSLFTSSEINVTFDTPTSVIAGESFIMKMEIDKGDISDFAKLQLNLPEGFTAELFEGKEGTFTFYDQKIKLIWISLPSEEKFDIKIKIKCDKSLVGDFNFNGKISYVLEGERKNKELVSPTFAVTTKSKPTSPTFVSTKTEVENNTSVSSASNTSQLSCSRSFDAKKIGPGETFLVTLKVKKSNVSGVGKIIENIPEGFTAKEIENNGAIFSQKDNQVKFLWMTLPSENEFVVSYKIMVDENLDGSKVIDGKMSYLHDDMTKNALIDGTSIEVTSTQQDIQTAGIEDKSKNETSVTNIEEKEIQENKKVENTIASNAEEIPTKIKSNVIKQNSMSTKDKTTTQKDIITASNEEKKSTQISNKSEENNISSEVNNTPKNQKRFSDNNTASIEKKESIQKESKVVTNEIASNHRVNYRVQICALRKKIETNYFTKNHNVTEKIYLNMHKGWHKYTVGNFKEYMSARQHRSNAKSNYKINGSFVTAYNDGSRITVQEALMITKDKWIAP